MYAHTLLRTTNTNPSLFINSAILSRIHHDIGALYSSEIFRTIHSSVKKCSLNKNPTIWSFRTNLCSKTTLNCGFSRLSKVEPTHSVLVSRNITCQRIVFNNKVAIDVNTNVVKDVILFRYENPKFFRILSIFSLCQFVFWTYLAHFSYTSLRDSPATTESNTAWWRRINLGENKYKNTLAALCLVIAYGILASAWLFTLKSIRYLVLHKGGKTVTFVSYTPFGENRLTTVNLNKVSCEDSRHSAKVQLPIKVEGHRLFYILDMRGEFLNPRLFDHTAGLKRMLNRHS